MKLYVSRINKNKCCVDILTQDEELVGYMVVNRRAGDVMWDIRENPDDPFPKGKYRDQYMALVKKCEDIESKQTTVN